jgi:hypothetical protein
MDEPMLFDDFHIHYQAQDVIRRTARAWHKEESPSHPSWQAGALFAQGQLAIQIQRAGFVTWRLTNPRKA